MSSSDKSAEVAICPSVRDSLQRAEQFRPSTLCGARFLVQGLLLGKYLHETYPTAVITEAHPVVLLRLLNTPALEPQLNPLHNLIADLTNAHKRDATIAAFAAWSMHTGAQGWRDLYPIETLLDPAIRNTRKLLDAHTLI